jgi:hypothetical protein
VRRRSRGTRRRRRGWRPLARWRSLPPAVRALLVFGLLCALAIAYQVFRKPTEVLAVVPASPKSPPSTWTAYGALFREYSTDVVRPELLAALVQVETAGDPLARTYWRWRFSWNPLDLYGPASSAVGLLQITDGTFAEARGLCIHRHRVVREGPWRGPRPCSSDDDRVRWLPGDAIEITAAWLDQSVREALRGDPGRATPAQRRRLAAVIHLCGRRRGAEFAGRRYRTLPGERCGDHRLAEYLVRVDRLADEFGRLAARDRGATPGRNRG